LRLFLDFRQRRFKLRLRIAQFGAEFDALHHDRFFLAVVKARQAQHPTFVDAGQIAVEFGYQAFLHPAEILNLRVLHQPVCVQRFFRPDNQRRFHWKRFNRGKLLLEAQAVALHKLGVDTSYIRILMAAIVDHKENAPVLCVMFFQSFHYAPDPARRALKLHALEGRVLPVAEYPQADRFTRVEKRAQKLLDGNIERFNPLHVPSPPHIAR
jgi:hypothetical protein